MKVILPGSYDPVTLGHLDLIKRAAECHEEVYAVVFINPEKKYTFSEKERVEMLSLAVADIPNVKVDFSSGYVVDYMREKGIEKIIKGYRSEKDLDYERVQAEYNLAHGGYQTELYACDPSLELVSSTFARELISEGKELENVLPKSVSDYIKNKKVQDSVN